MDAGGAREARLLHVERGMKAMDQDLRRRAIALRQGIWQEWIDFDLIPALMSSVTTYISGDPVAACSRAFSGLTVTVMNHATSAVLGTGTNDVRGDFSVTMMISCSMTVDMSIGVAGWVTSTVNTTIAAGGSFTTG